MNNLIIIESTPAIFKVDFKAAKKKLETQLKKYDVVVTIDTVADAKKLATDLNKQATELSENRKDAVYEVSEPIRAFEADMKHLVTMCKDGREKILSQVQKFEDETRREIKTLLTERRGELWTENNVEAKFRTAKIDDLVILTNMTGTGKLSAKAKAEIENRVNRDKQQQTNIEMRLLQLENRCFKAGLKTPLTEVHVEAFLYAPEQDYNTRLDSLIYVEVKRQDETEAKLREEASKAEEAKRAEEARKIKASLQAEEFDRKSKDLIDNHPGEESSKRLDDDSHLDTSGEKQTVDPTESEKTSVQEKTQSVKSGNVVRIVTATFEVSVPATVSDERIEAKFTEKLSIAGFTSIQSIKVNKK